MLVDIAKIVPIIKSKLEKQLIPATILLDKFKAIEETSKHVSAYTDPNYAPFYYYLGTLIEPKNFVEIGFKLGLLSGCFFQGCKTVKNFLGFQQKTDEFYSPRMAKSNIKRFFKGDFDFYLGETTDKEWLNCFSKNNWDLVLVNEQKDYDFYRMCLDVVWEKLENGGLIVVEYALNHEPCKKAFSDFCKIKNREYCVMSTRQGTGLIQK